MSVRERRRLFEEQPVGVAKSKPRAPSIAVSFDGAEEPEELRPQLPPRPGSHSDPSKKTRPLIPPKSKSISSKIVTTRKDYTFESQDINLIDLDDEHPKSAKLRLLEPQAINEDDDDSEGSFHRFERSAENLVRVQRTPSPLRNVQTGLSQFRIGTSETLDKAEVPKIFRTVSENAQSTFKKVQIEAPKVWQGFAGGTQKAFSNVQSDAPKAFKTASERMQKVANDVNAGIKRTVSGVPIPKAFAETGEDLADLTKLSLGKPGICSRCASLPLDKCFSVDSGVEQAYIPWSTPLSRIALHAKWCRLCQLLLSMLCRREHDPLLLPEIRDFIKPEWLRGIPLHKWVSEGYIHQDEYWPFGRSEYRDEGSTQVVGPFADKLWEVAKQTRGVGIKLLARSAAGRRPQLRSTDFHKSSRQRYKEGYLRGKKQSSRFPISCVVMITVSAKYADVPGLLWVDLVGCSNAPGAEERALSHFMLRAMKDGFAVNVSANKSLSYGHSLDRHWIDTSIGKLWLAECELRHGTRCSEHGWAVAMRRPTFLRLLDVETLQIIVAGDPSSCRYIALSYVWGGADMLKLRYTNLKQLSVPHGLENYLPQLPQTVLDALEVVRDLGERYLWVDALCILQEDTNESREQIANMDSVYGSALLTIVAAGGTNAHAGLQGVRRRHFAQPGRQLVERQILQSSAKINNDITVIAPATNQQNLETSEWNGRAWTFQEKLLSRRLITFADGEAVWHCRCMIAREDMPVADTGYEYDPLDWLNLKPAYLGIGTEEHWKDGSLEVTRHGLTHVVRSGTFAEYARMIEQYSSRKITYDSDAINALAGLLRIFSLCFQAECIYGLPANLLDVALFWRPTEPLEKRGVSNLPSWSWAAWKGCVAYDDPIEIRRDESGQMMETEGTRALLRYFVLDKYTGTLQPLNGTGRGLPLTDDEIPSEWEAHLPSEGCHSRLHSCKTPEVLDLDPRAITQLSDKHLVFWTSASDAFSFGDLPTQWIDFAWPSVKRYALLDSA